MPVGRDRTEGRTTSTPPYERHVMRVAHGGSERMARQFLSDLKTRFFLKIGVDKLGKGDYLLT
jgi:hypothetical protein